MLNQTSNRITFVILLLVILVTSTIGTVHAQTASEIDIATGAGSSLQASCVTTNNCFSPNPLTVAPGTTVTWKNTDTTTHYVCSGKPTDDQCGTVFEGDGIKSGKTFQFTFANAGTFDYYCSVHPRMTGQVIVGASGTAPTPQPTPPTISITTDKQSYNQGDTIVISGTVSNYIANTLVNIRIIDPIGNLVKVDQVDLGSDRTFSTSITATGALWQEAGTYQVKTQYGSLNTTAITIFQFSGSSGNGQGENTVKVDGTDLSVKYSITNAQVLDISANTQSKSLIVSIQTTGDGVLTITLPRTLTNAILPTGQDDKYYVLVDGQEADFQETSTTKTDRTLSIPFIDGTEEIEIIGTQIVPEFGPIAALVLAIAIISIIAVSAKTGLRFMPKY